MIFPQQVMSFREGVRAERDDAVGVDWPDAGAEFVEQFPRGSAMICSRVTENGSGERQ